MNSNPDDPNNHVPPITPEDDWDDLDESTERSRIGLPPRRVERGLPPKKESLAEKVSLKARMMIMESDVADSVGTDDDGQSPPEESEDKPKPTSRTSRRKQLRRGKVNKEATQEESATPPEVSQEESATPPEVSQEESATPPEASQEVAVVLPLSKMGKRARVNEINPGGDKPTSRPASRSAAIVTIVAIVAKIHNAEPDAKEKDVVQKRRRFLRGERMDWGTKEGRGSMKWMLLTGLGVAGLVVLAVVMNQRAKNTKKRDREQSHYSSMALEEDESAVIGKGTDEIDKLLNNRSEAESIFTSYATAKSPEDFIGLVHAPDRNREQIESKWKPLGMKADWVPGRDSSWYVMDGEKDRFAILEGVLGDFTAFRAFFRQDEEGQLKMDWKATSGYNSADFADLKSGKGDGSEVRVWLSPASFYTFSFPEGEYRSFRIKSPENETTVWGYVPAGSELDQELQKLFSPGQITGETKSEIQAILSLGSSDGESLPEQWLITDIMRTDWLDE